MMIGKKCLFGFHIERAMGSDRNWYLAIVVWLPRDFSGKRLRYFYPFNRYGLRVPAPRR
jgi:hypothetical protein